MGGKKREIGRGLLRKKKKTQAFLAMGKKGPKNY